MICEQTGRGDLASGKGGKGGSRKAGGGGGGSLASDENVQKFAEQTSTGETLSRDSLQQFEASATPQERQLFQQALDNNEFRATGIDSRIDFMGQYASQKKISGKDLSRFKDAFDMSFNGAGPRRADKSKAYSQEILQGRFQKAYSNLTATQKNILASRIYPSRSQLNGGAPSRTSTTYGRDIARRAESVLNARDAAANRKAESADLW